MDKMGFSNMVTDIPQQSLPAEQMQMLRILIKRMLTETDPERLRMFTEQIRDITAVQSAMEPSRKAA
jgi:hypothetical protein